MTKFYVQRQRAYPHSERTLGPVLAWTAKQLEPFDLSLVEEVKFYVTRSSRQASTGYCWYPHRVKKRSREFKRGYRISVGVAIDCGYFWPRERDVAVGTESITGIQQLEGLLAFDDRHRKASARGWRYVHRRETFYDYLEEAAFVAGHEAFHFLRHSKQVLGINRETKANVYGLEWLKVWRRERSQWL